MRRDAKANLMVLDWEEHKALRILLQERLVRLLGLNCRCNDDDLFCLGLFDDEILDFDVVNDRSVGIEGEVLFASSLEVKLLNG